jgi:hypothetical protein
VVHISALPLLPADASARLVHVSEGELETEQSEAAVSLVVLKTSNAPAGTLVSECVVADEPVLVSLLCITTTCAKRLFVLATKKTSVKIPATTAFE